MTYSKAPYIKAGDHLSDLFDSLTQSYPGLHRLVQLILLNRQVLQKLFTQPCTHEDVIELESVTGHAWTKIGPQRDYEFHDNDRPEVRFERFVQIHMFWYVAGVAKPYSIQTIVADRS